jgi:hypothetical protein
LSVAEYQTPDSTTPDAQVPGEDAKARRPDTHKLALYLFLAALAVRILYLSQYAASPFFWVPALDSLDLDLRAQAIASGTGVEGAFFRAPLYYYFLAGIYKVFGHHFLAVRGIQAVIGAASCVLLYAVGRRVFPHAVALLAAGAMAFYGPLVFFDGELLAPVLEVFFDLVFLLALLRATSERRPTIWAVAGLALGVAAITRPNVLVALPLGLFAALDFRGRRPAGYRPIPSSAAFLLCALIAPGAVTVRNYLVAGDPVFIASQGGVNLFLGNRSAADGFTPSTPKRYPFSGPYEDSVALFGQRAAEEAVGHPLTASAAQSYWVHQVTKWWRAHPAEALALTWRKWVLAWTHREIRNNVAFAFFRKEVSPLLGVLPFGFWIAGPLGLLGAALAWRDRKETRLLILFALLYVLGIVVFFAADRYRLPVVPLLLLFGAHAAVWCWGAVRERNWRRVAPAAAALAGLALFVNADWYQTVTPATWAADYWSAGNRYHALGKLDEAEAQYRQALALDPGNEEIWTNLGGVQYYAGRPTDAEASFREAIRLSPRSASGHYNLALCELALGRRGAARPLLETALRLEPGHHAARVELAELGPPSSP